MNLKAQEIRTSLYHSKFYDMLYRLNIDPRWRQLTPNEVPDLNMKDVEILLRGFAMLKMGDQYAPSMTKFLNNFSHEMRSAGDDDIAKLEHLFSNFLTYVSALGDRRIFFGSSQKFNISVYEAVFVALCRDGINGEGAIKETSLERIGSLKNDPEFIEATQKSTANTAMVELRLHKANEML
jgi:hypothetical protein